nr:hypothetical protein [Tanacetum cinerariifolium]
HVVIDTHVECHAKYAKLEVERYEYMIRYFVLFDNDKQHRKQIDDQEVLFDKMSVELVELDKHVRDLKNGVLEKDFKIYELEECVLNKDLEIEKCLECLNVCENKIHKMGQTNQTVHMIMPSKDTLYNGRKGIGFKNPRYFEKAKDLRHSLYDEKVIGLGNETAKDLWDALERQMRGYEYGEQDRKAAILQTKNLMDINIDALYNILKQNQGDVNDALGYKKKAVVVTSNPLTLVAEKTKATKRKEKVKVQSESEESNDEDITFSSANKKPEYVKFVEKKVDEKKRDMSKVKCYNYKKEGHFAKDCKKAKVKDYSYYKTNMLLAKKDSDEQVLLVDDQAWMKSSSDSDQEINANMVFVAQIEKVLSDSDESSSSAEKTIAEVAYYTSESESEFEYETSEYYDKSNNYGLFVNDNDDQEIFHDAIESASENFIENHIDSQKDYDKSEVDYNDSEKKEHLIDKLIQKFNHKIAKCHKCIEKANQQSKDLENQNKDLQENYDVLINQVNTFEVQNNEFNEQIEVLNEKNADLLA